MKLDTAGTTNRSTPATAATTATIAITTTSGEARVGASCTEIAKGEPRLDRNHV